MKPVQQVVTEAVTQTDYQADSRSKFSDVKLPKELLIIVVIINNKHLYKKLSLKPSHKLINNATEAQNLWVLVLC